MRNILGNTVLSRATQNLRLLELMHVLLTHARLNKRLSAT